MTNNRQRLACVAQLLAGHELVTAISSLESQASNSSSPKPRGVRKWGSRVARDGGKGGVRVGQRRRRRPQLQHNLSVQDTIVRRWQELRGREGAQSLLLRHKTKGRHDDQHAVTVLKMFLREHRERLGWSIYELEQTRRQVLQRQEEEEAAAAVAAAVAAAAAEECARVRWRGAEAGTTSGRREPPGPLRSTVSLAQAASISSRDPAMLAVLQAQEESDRLAAQQKEEAAAAAAAAEAAAAAKAAAGGPVRSISMSGGGSTGDGVGFNIGLISRKLGAMAAQSMRASRQVPRSTSLHTSMSVKAAGTALTMEAGHGAAAAAIVTLTADKQGIRPGQEDGAPALGTEHLEPGDSKAKKVLSFARHLRLRVSDSSDSRGSSVKGDDDGPFAAAAAASGSSTAAVHRKPTMGNFGSMGASKVQRPATATAPSPLMSRISQLWPNAPQTVQSLLGHDAPDADARHTTSSVPDAAVHADGQSAASADHYRQFLLVRKLSTPSPGSATPVLGSGGLASPGLRKSPSSRRRHADHPSSESGWSTEAEEENGFAVPSLLAGFDSDAPPTVVTPKASKTKRPGSAASRRRRKSSDTGGTPRPTLASSPSFKQANQAVATLARELRPGSATPLGSPAALHASVEGLSDDRPGSALRHSADLRRRQQQGPHSARQVVSWVSEAASTERRLLRQILQSCADLPPQVQASLADVAGDEVRPQPAFWQCHCCLT